MVLGCGNPEAEIFLLFNGNLKVIAYIFFVHSDYPLTSLNPVVGSLLVCNSFPVDFLSLSLTSGIPSHHVQRRFDLHIHIQSHFSCASSSISNYIYMSKYVCVYPKVSRLCLSFYVVASSSSNWTLMAFSKETYTETLQVFLIVDNREGLFH